MLLVLILVVGVLVQDKAPLKIVVLPAKPAPSRCLRFIKVANPPDQEEIVPRPVLRGAVVGLGTFQSLDDGDAFISLKLLRSAGGEFYERRLSWMQNSHIRQWLTAALYVLLASSRRPITKNNLGVAVLDGRSCLPSVEYEKASGQFLSRSPNFASRAYKSDGEPWAMGCNEGGVGNVGSPLGSFRGSLGFRQPLRHILSHSGERLLVALHSSPLAYSNYAKSGSSNRQQEGEDREEQSTEGGNRIRERTLVLVFLAACYVPLLGLGIKLVNDGHTRLALTILGIYLWFFGCSLLLFGLSAFRWSLGWWL